MQNNPDTGMRFDDSTVMKLLRLAQEKDQKRDVVKEVEAEYIKALNGIARTRNGQFVIKYLLKASGVYAVETGSDIVKMADARGRRNYFLEMVWNYLTPANRIDIE